MKLEAKLILPLIPNFLQVELPSGTKTKISICELSNDDIDQLAVRWGSEMKSKAKERREQKDTLLKDQLSAKGRAAFK